MMNIVLKKLYRFGRIRHLHTTIISQETIKPFSPTPAHLKTYNLSLIDDKYVAPIHIPMVFFYKKNHNNNFNNNHGDIINTLKKSLSQCLTQYYPFAGRFPTTCSPDHVDCNDAGVEFLEASIDSRLDDFVVKKLEKDDDTLGHLVPHSRLGSTTNETNTHIVEVQLNHFTCGGVALGVSIAHKVADGFTAVNFLRHWAAVTRGETPPVKLSFSSSSSSSSSSPVFSTTDQVAVKPVKNVTRRFLFSKSKLNELKNKIINASTSSSTSHPTRVDSLTSLISKCAMDAAFTTKSGSSTNSQQYANLVQTVNLRGGSIFPKLGAGNMIGLVSTSINNNAADSSLVKMIKLNEVIITSLRKQRMELQGVRDVEEIGKKWENIVSSSTSTIMDGRIVPTYFTTSFCRFPLNEVDFGWGKPERAVLRGEDKDVSMFIFMDAPSGDGIEAIVSLEEEEMAIFQQDKELLAYTTQQDT